MAKLLHSATMSLDGFIAGPGGDMQWLRRHLGPNELVDDLVPRIGALLVACARCCSSASTPAWRRRP